LLVKTRDAGVGDCQLHGVANLGLQQFARGPWFALRFYQTSLDILSNRNFIRQYKRKSGEREIEVEMKKRGGLRIVKDLCFSLERDS
jgi:hypothetical protein